MEQSTFADLEHDSKKRRTRREVFLDKMDALIPWERLEGRIEPLYPKAGRGRRPYPLSVMLLNRTTRTPVEILVVQTFLNRPRVLKV